MNNISIWKQPMTSPRILLSAWNLKAKKQFGQNFLSEPATASMIVSRADISAEDVVVEIGAGLGALTIPIARVARSVFAIERDHQLIKLLKIELAANGISNVDILEQDVLGVDMHKLAEKAGRKLIIAGNLPYNISSQILIKLIHSRSDLSRAILMFQKELARRIAAKPGKKDYGRITAMLRYCADLKSVATISASNFFPKPNVESEVLEIKFNTNQDYPDHDENMLFKVIKAAFGNRRKTLKNSLVASGLGIDPQTALNGLLSAAIEPSRRAETLAPSEFVALEIGLRNAMPKIADE